MWTCHFTHATKANEVGVVLAKGVNKGVPQQQQQQEYQLFVQLQVGNKRTDMWQSFLNGILLDISLISIEVKSSEWRLTDTRAKVTRY